MKVQAKDLVGGTVILPAGVSVTTRGKQERQELSSTAVIRRAQPIGADKARVYWKRNGYLASVVVDL